MGYWATSMTGASLQLVGDLNPDGSEMLWGDAPADCIDGGLHNLITRMHADLGRFPTVAEVDAARPDAPEMLAAIEKAKKVFAEDIERPATDGEIAAGLAFSDTEIALDSDMRADITVGDVIRWAVMREAADGPWSEIDYVAEAVVESIEERQAVSSWSGSVYTKVVYVVTHDGVKTDVDRSYANKVLPGDQPVEVENAKREEQRKQEWTLTDDEGDDDQPVLFPLMYNRKTAADGE